MYGKVEEAVIIGKRNAEPMELFNDSTIRALLFSFGAVIARIAALPVKMSWKIVTRKIIVALFIGLVADTIVTDWAIAEKWRTSIVVLLALFADDILAVLLDMGSKFRKNPKGLIKTFIKYFKKS
jgi:uncharacterized membrane protein